MKQKLNYQELSGIIKNSIEKNDAYTIYYNCLDEAVPSLVNLEHNDRFMKVANLIYNEYTEFQKLASILSAAILMDQYKEKTESLTNEEIALLSCYSSIGVIEYQRQCFEMYTPETLHEICKKTPRNDRRLKYLELTEWKYPLNEQQQMQKFIHDRSVKELDDEVAKIKFEDTFEEFVKETGFTL
jgi:hypothetical protein